MPWTVSTAMMRSQTARERMGMVVSVKSHLLYKTH